MKKQIRQAVAVLSSPSSRWFRVTLCGITFLGSLTTMWGQSPKSDSACADLARLSIPEATITLAEVVIPMAFKLPVRADRPPGSDQAAPGGQHDVGPPGGGQGTGRGNMALAPFDPKDTTNHVPFCRVAATLKPSGDSNIKIEVWLPVTGWNGKMMGAGDFGWAGSIMYGGLLLGLEHHFAVVSTDTGHDNSLPNGHFALGHPDKIIDYGYRAAHSMTVDAKLFIKAFYGKLPTHSFWFGCSLGGQMGLTEINRFPEDYDGAIVGAPASPIVELNAFQMWPALLVQQDPARQFSQTKATLLRNAVMNSCDALDGAKDGELEDPMACHFDPATLLCKGANSDTCLTATQVAFVKTLDAGMFDSRTGEKLFEGAVPGNEPVAGGGPMDIASALYRYLIYQNPKWDPKTLDLDRDVTFGRAALRTVNENQVATANLKPFFDHGGKLLWYHGWNDGSSPLQSVRYIDAVKQSSGAALTDDSVRFFAVPGMGHCSGGSGCDVFDKLAALDTWIETGTAPERIVASKLQNGKVVRTHPLCAWPMLAKYQGTGDVNDAANFACVKRQP